MAAASAAAGRSGATGPLSPPVPPKVPLSPPVGLRAPAPDVKLLMAGLRESKVTFRNIPNEKLSGKFVNGGSDSVVILCHGMLSSKDSNFLPLLARELSLKRLSSLRFDFSGNGDSEGALEYSPYAREVSDLRQAIVYVRGTLGKNVVAIVGHSQGAGDVIQYAGQYDDVPLVVNVAGRFDNTRGPLERFGPALMAQVEKLGQVPVSVKNAQGKPINMMVTKQGLADRRAVNMAAVCGKITISEVLTLHGTADTTIPVEDAQAFARSIRQHTLQLVEGGDHCFTGPGQSELVVKRILDFIQANL